MRRPDASLASDESAVGACGLKALYEQLDSLPTQAQPDEDGEYATGAALDRARDFLASTNEALASADREGAAASWFASGAVTTDGRGGVRIEWWRGRHSCVYVVVGGTNAAGEYLFVKTSADDPGEIDRAAPPLLASRLRAARCEPALERG